MDDIQGRVKHFHWMHNFPLDLFYIAPGLKDKVRKDPTSEVARNKTHKRYLFLLNTEKLSNLVPLYTFRKCNRFKGNQPFVH